jgi:hypothetical protein
LEDGASEPSNVRKKPRNRSGQLRAMVGSHGPIVVEAGRVAK